MNISKGKSRKPPRVVVYGTEGIGKSTFGNTAPAPIFLPTEDGLGEIDCERFPLAKSYDEFIGNLGQLCQAEHNYQTAVVDTLDWLEKLIWAKVARDSCGIQVGPASSQSATKPAATELESGRS